MIVAIDGPAASGKSTVSKALARRLGMAYLDTGAMYRAIAWAALQAGIEPQDAETVVSLAHTRELGFVVDADDRALTRVTVDGVDVADSIRTPQVDAAVSFVARMPDVRRALVARQREMASVGDWVVEGRDIGTVVFPDAPLKIYLEASSEERARRRTLDMHEGGFDLGAADVQRRLEERDAKDSTREVSPLQAAPDAVLLDTTGLSVDGVVDVIIRSLEERS